MSKVCVTGVAGFLGSHLAERLLDEGHEVWGVDNLMGGDFDNIPHGVQFHEADCADLHAHYMPSRTDLVYHCAAAPHEGLSVFSPNVIWRNTATSTIAVATQAIQRGVKRIVFTSSMARYGDSCLLPFREQILPMPVDPYGVAKVASEQALFCLGKAHNMEVVVLVPHSIIGPKQRRSDPYRNVAAIMMNLMLQGRQPFIYGDGEQTRCFSFIQDCIDPMIKAGFEKGLDGEVINIGPDEEFVTINELAKRIAKVMNFNLSPVYFNERPCEVKHAYCSSDKARKLLDYKTTHTLDQGLWKMSEWMREVGPKEFEYHLPIEIDSPKVPRTWKKRLM